MNEGMELVFLGTGTSVGVPAIGCGCEVCRSEDPRNKRRRCSVWIRVGDFSLVVDTGADFRAQCLDAGITRVDAVLISHAHCDHIMGFDDLRRPAAGLDRRLPVYALPETLEVLRRCFAHAFDPSPPMPGYLSAVGVEVGGVFAVGPLEVTPVPVKHGHVATTGFVFRAAGIEPVAYVSDVKEITPEGMAALEGVGCLILDGLRDRPHPTHLTVADALEVSAALGNPPTWLTHFSCDLDHAELERRLPPHVRPAYDKLKLNFPEN